MNGFGMRTILRFKLTPGLYDALNVKGNEALKLLKNKPGAVQLGGRRFSLMLRQGKK